MTRGPCTASFKSNIPGESSKIPSRVTRYGHGSRLITQSSLVHPPILLS